MTGGARGIGLMIAAGFAMNGARVAISSRDAEANEAAVVKLAELGVGIGKDAFCVPADLSDKEEVERVAAEVGEKFGGKSSDAYLGGATYLETANERDGYLKASLRALREEEEAKPKGSRRVAG